MKSNNKSTKVDRSIIVNEACPNIDWRWGPWDNATEALNTLGASGYNVLCEGLTIGIKNQDGTVDEYWFKGGTDAAHLVKKFSSMYVDTSNSTLVVGEYKYGLTKISGTPTPSLAPNRVPIILDNKEDEYETSYEDFEITEVAYNKLSNDGGEVTPTIKTRQQVYKNFSDGTKEATGVYVYSELSSGGVWNWTYLASGVEADNNGKVTSDYVNEEIADVVIASGILTITANEQTATKSFEVKQKGLTELAETWENLTITEFSYNDIPANGGIAYPTVKYKEQKVRNFVGGKRIETGIWEENHNINNAIITFSKEDGYEDVFVDTNTGAVASLQARTTGVNIAEMKVRIEDDEYIATNIAEARAVVKQTLTAVVELASTYEDPIVTLAYSGNPIPWAGGTATPTVTYKQKVTRNYSDGSTRTEWIQNTGGTIVWTGCDEGGVISAEQNNGSAKSVATVSVSVTMNGKTGSSVQKTISQDGKPAEVANWYVGQITKSSADFANLTTDELLAVSEAIPTTTKSKDITINNSIWFIMVPEGVTPKSAQYTSGGLTTPFNSEDITGGVIFKSNHADVTISGKTYYVYGNRNGGLVDSNTPGNFTIN